MDRDPSNVVMSKEYTQIHTQQQIQEEEEGQDHQGLNIIRDNNKANVQMLEC